MTSDLLPKQPSRSEDIMRVQPRFSRFTSKPWVAGSTATFASFFTLSAIGCYRDRVVGIQAFFFPPDQPANILISIVLGILVGALFSDKFRPYRKYLWWLLLTLIVIGGIKASPPWSYATWFLVAAIATYKLLKDRLAARRAEKPTTFGSAEWADLEHIQERKLTGTSGYMLGTFVTKDGKRFPIHYTGDRHLLTVAPTRGGKGVSAIIPNLLTYTGSVLVIDPKGENARITARQRQALGQVVQVVDPWGVTGMEIAQFNPLDWLDPDDPDIDENAFMLADAMIVRSGKGDTGFWDDESAALLWGLILYVALDKDPKADRSLATVRDFITLPEDQFDELLKKMYDHDNAVVASTGARTLSKDPRLRPMS